MWTLILNLLLVFCAYFHITLAIQSDGITQGLKCFSMKVMLRVMSKDSVILRFYHCREGT